VTAARANPGTRREPVQRRSRERVERILDAASDLIVEDGLAALSTRTIAERADIPVASLYQYFADRDEILLALVKRDTAEMDDAVAEAVAGLTVVSVRTLVTATMRAFVRIYHQRPAFVVIWWRGRANSLVDEFCRAHNKRIASNLFAFADAMGMVPDGKDRRIVELAVEVGDRVFQLAFEHDLRGDELLIEEGIEMVTGYLERHSTPGGVAGIPQDDPA
jgi:AcrR family transcriptional regulator